MVIFINTRLIMKNFIDELKWRGMLQNIIPGTEDHLNNNKSLGYIGFDPTSDSLHVGSLVPIFILMHFQKYGHTPVVLLGGATGMIGDPSGKSDERKLLDKDILDFKDKNKFEYAGAAGGFVDLYGYPYCRGRVFNHLEEDTNQYNDVTEIFWASGACFFIRAKVYHQLSGFDEDYFAHQEEVDLCWRAQNEGFQVKYVGTSKVFHIGGATLKEESPRKSFLNLFNTVLNKRVLS